MLPTLQIVGYGLNAVLVCAAGLCLGCCLRFRKLREDTLESAVHERTVALERERSRERSRNRVLEMLLSRQPLGAVLDEIGHLVCSESPGAVWIVVLRNADRSFVVSAPGVSPEMKKALETDYAVPFEAWSGSTEFRRPASDPAWKILLDQLNEPPPAVILTRALGMSGGVMPERGAGDRGSGVCLILDRSDSALRIGREELDHASRLAQLAIEHSRFCDDLSFQARHDSLTGMPNRAMFDDILTQEMAEARSTNRKAAVLYVDLDGFKQINDTMNHRVGDLYLTETARRMQSALRPCDTVARIGGDEFNVLLTGLDSAAEAEALARRVREALSRPAAIEGHTVISTASIGISLFPDDGVEAEDLLRQADAAMYYAKELGGNRVQAFSAKNHTLDSVRLDQELKKALRDRLFEVHYQPKVSAGGEFAGMEALLRLNHPVYGQIPPARFIPVAEESGLIVPLGAWVLGEVCRQIAEWRSAGFGHVAVAVNVSPVQICRPDFAAEVEDCLRRYGVSPRSLELELTESLLIGSGEETQKQMGCLRELGIRFSIDDFGTGYSSLSYLHRLRVDAIKLDRSFVQSVDTDEAARRLVQAMIGVAEGLGLGVIAEGVETEEQRKALIAAGCPTMQGYLFSRPRAAADLEDYLRAAASNTDDLLRIEKALSVTPVTAATLAQV
jgi:diguanylate cyclase (GGDEF)-like protein